MRYFDFPKLSVTFHTDDSLEAASCMSMGGVEIDEGVYMTLRVAYNSGHKSVDFAHTKDSEEDTPID